jgi:hypothetical protein
MHFRANASQLEKRKHLSRAVAETLEPRRLLSLAPIGGEIHVNTFTADFQTNAAVAADADGDFVVVWQSAQEGLNNAGIYAQRYNASGVPQGGEIHVNINTAGAQNIPAVAMDPDGDFVVAWRDNTHEGNNNGGIFARRFDAAGNPVTGEIHVNTIVDGSQEAPAVAMDAAGNFVITFETLPASSLPDVYARRFDFNGVPQGPEFLVNTTTAGYQRAAAVAMDMGGDFVITWQSYLQDDSGYGIYARRYNSAGVAQTGEVPVNTATVGHQMAPSIAMDADGDYVIAWDEFNLAGTSYAIYAQRYNAAGVAQGGSFPASATTSDRLFGSSIGMSASGGFLVSWQRQNLDGSGWGIFSQQFAANGSPLGTEFRVNTTTANNQQNVSVAADANGNYIVAWQSTDQVGDPGDGIYAQRYRESAPDTVAPIVAGAFLNSRRILPYSSHAGPMQQLVVSFSENLTDAGGATGINSIANPANWLLTKDGADITSDISSIAYGYNPATNRYEARVNLATSHTAGNFLLKLKDVVRDIAGNRLDGNVDALPTGSFLLPFSVATFGAQADDFRVNTTTQFGQSSPDVAIDAAGNFVVVFNNTGQPGISFHRYSAAGVPLGDETPVTTMGSGFPEVVMNPSGDFIVTWYQGFSDSEIYARRYRFDGVPYGDAFHVNTATANRQEDPTIAMDGAGNFVIAWISLSQDAVNTFGIYAQRFSLTGVPLGSEFPVNSTTSGHQSQPTIGMDAAGNFTIAWSSDLQDAGTSGIYAQRFNAAGAKLGGEFRVNSYSPLNQHTPSLAMTPGGQFVVAFAGFGPGDSINQTYARLYDSAGIAQGDAFRVNTDTVNGTSDPNVAITPQGDITVTWGNLISSGNISARRFSAAGVGLGAEFTVPSVSTGRQDEPRVAIDPDGDAVITWRDNSRDGSSYGIYARRFNLNGTPTVGSVSANPEPVASGNSFTLTASSAVDDGTVSSVSFYRESNNEPGLQVGAFGDTLVGSTNVNNSGFWSASISTTGLAAGSYTYYAQGLDNLGLIGAPASITSTVTPSASAPVLTASAFIFQTAPQRLSFTFDADVHASLSSGSVTVQRLSPNPATISVSSPAWDSSTNTATFNFTGILPDGNYLATLNGSTINAGGPSMSSNPTLPFFFLNGDLNRDRSVTIADFLALASKFGQGNAIWTDGDLNYDTQVTIADFLALAGNFNKTLPEPLMAMTAHPAAGEVLDEKLDRVGVKGKQAKAKVKTPTRTRAHHRRVGRVALFRRY